MPSDNDLALARKIDAACDRFEADWKCGRQPKVADYCREATGSELDSLRKALEAVERELIERSRNAGDTSVSQAAVQTGASKPAAPTETIPARIGRFEVRSVLGTGAFGRVYLAHDPQLLRDVAIKVPLPGTLASDGDRERFLREARAAATIQHPNICPVHEIGEDGGNPFIVTAYIPGQSLAAQLSGRKEPLSEKQAAQIVRKLALALDAAHRKGVIHRDLKPANVMFDKERKDVVIMDFGLARAPRHGDAQATQSGVIMGTPAYMSPEQARGNTKAVGPASDVYSLGVILYELLTGRRPFAGSVMQVIGQILHVPPEPPSKHRPGLDPRLEAICMSAMEKDQAVRIATAKALAKALLEVLQEPAAGHSTPTAVATAPPASAAPTSPTVAVWSLAGPPSSNSQAEMFQQLVGAFAAGQEETTSAVHHRAGRKSRRPLWQPIAAGAAVLALAAIAVHLFLRTPTATVTINVGVDLQDASLSFVLDRKPVAADDLAKPIELTVGDHELVILRGEALVKRMRFQVSGGANPAVAIKEVTGPEKGSDPPPAPVDGDDRRATEWALRRGASGVRRVDEAAERRAAEWILAVGGTVTVEGASGQQEVKSADQLPNAPFVVVAIALVQRPLEDGDLARLAGLSRVTRLDLGHSPVTDAALTHLKDLESLTWLSLTRTGVTGTGLPELKGLTRLGYLELAALDLTDRELAQMPAFPELRELYLSETKVTNAGMPHLKERVGLRKLSLGRTAVSDEGLTSLSGMKDLKELILAVTTVTDAGLAQLAGLSQLETLNLHMAAEISDTGLVHLKGLTRLKSLRVTKTKVTAEGVKELLKSLPDLQVIRQ